MCNDRFRPFAYQYSVIDDFRNAKLQHLSRATLGLGSFLSTDIREKEVDAILAGNIQLYKQAWSSFDQVSEVSTHNATLDLEIDIFFRLANRMKKILQHSNIPQFLRRSPIFSEEF